MKERTMVFSVGLILFCLAASFLFEIVWLLGVTMYIRTGELAWLFHVPPTLAVQFLPRIVGSILFLVIGMVMMRSGRRKGDFRANGS